VLPKQKYIKDFLNVTATQDAIAINWRMFGSAGHKKIQQGLITEIFNRRAPDDFSSNRHIKSIVRPEIVKNIINPHFFTFTRKYWYSFKRYRYSSPNGSPLIWIKPGKTAAVGLSDTARIHHYFTKSLEHYQKKIAKGNADSKNCRLNVFEYNNRNDVFDDSITKIYSEELKRIRQIKDAWEHQGKDILNNENNLL